MTRVLLVTNDFPPRRGGIQSYLEELVGQLVLAGSHTLTVYAPKWKGSDAFDVQARATGYSVVRHPSTLMLPVPAVAARMRRLIAEHDVDTVWFGAAAPLALLAPWARRAGAGRVVASTHGHEVGWSMLPVARTALRRIGDDTDVVTFVSRYTRRRFASAFGPDAALEHLPPGVDIERFRPDPAARTELRARYRLGDRPVVVCVSRLVPRKGQDMLIRALPVIRQRIDGVALVIVGGGPYRSTLHRLAHRYAVADHVVFTDGVPGAELPAHHAMADVFAMPCRTRGAGLDVEGLGIVYPRGVRDGSAGGGGSTPAAHPRRCVTVKPVWSSTAGTSARSRPPSATSSPTPAGRPGLGAAGRRWVVDNWQWRYQAARLGVLLSG